MVSVENTVVGLTGNKGDGKTLNATFFSMSEIALNIKNKLYSNYKIECDNFSYLNAEELILNPLLFDNTIIAIDELHEYADSRNSSTLQNKFVSSFFLQSRHTESNIYYTTQFLDQIDKRIRRITDIIIECKNLYIDTDNDGNNDLFEITIIDFRFERTLTQTLYLQPIFNLYNTKEIINPFMLSKKRQKEILEIIEERNKEKYKNYETKRN
jgi:hypothetical protein